MYQNYIVVRMGGGGGRPIELEQKELDIHWLIFYPASNQTFGDNRYYFCSLFFSGTLCDQVRVIEYNKTACNVKKVISYYLQDIIEYNTA